MRLAQKTELRIAGSVRQARIHSTRHALCCCRARVVARRGGIHPERLPRAAGLCHRGRYQPRGEWQAYTSLASVGARGSFISP